MYPVAAAQLGPGSIAQQPGTASASSFTGSAQPPPGSSVFMGTAPVMMSSSQGPNSGLWLDQEASNLNTSQASNSMSNLAPPKPLDKSPGDTPGHRDPTLVREQNRQIAHLVAELDAARELNRKVTIFIVASKICLMFKENLTPLTPKSKYF